MLEKADPRAKLFVVSSISLLAVFSRELPALVTIAIITLLLLPLFACDIKRTLGNLKSFFSILLSLVIIQSVFTRGGTPIIQFGSVVIVTENGISMAVSFFLRMLIIAFSASILSTSTSREIIQGLVQMKVPYELAFMASMGLRFLPILRNQLRDVLVAMELRGIDFKSASISQKLHLFGHMFTPVVAGAIISSRQISISVQLRGFRAFPERSSHFQLHFGILDTLLVTTTTVGCVVFFFIF